MFGAQGELVLCRYPQVEPNVVMRAPSHGEASAEARSERLGGQEYPGLAGLEVVGEGKARVLSDQAVQVGSPGAVVAQDEEWLAHLGGIDLGTVELLLAPGLGRVEQAADGSERPPGPERRRDGEAIVAQDHDPVAEGDPLKRREKPASEK